MSYEVILTRSAGRDLEDIFTYIETHDSLGAALHVLEGFENPFGSLETLPNRGAIPAELEDLGITEFREVFFKPYRVIYEVTETQVVVYLIADGRRDMRTLLERRLLSS